MDFNGFVRNPFVQFIVFRFPGRCFVGICLVQGSESIRHILVDGSDALHQIVIHSLDHLVLGFIGTDPGGGFFGQSRIQVGDIFADGIGCFDDGSVLYGGIGLAHILVGSLLFQIFLHIGDAGIQFSRFAIRIFSGCLNLRIRAILGIDFYRRTGSRRFNLRGAIRRKRRPSHRDNTEKHGQSRSGLCHFLPSHGTASVFGLAFGQFGNHHVHAPCFVPDHFINPVHKATPLFLNSPVFSFSCIFWWVSHARFGLPVTFSLPKSLKFPIIPWYTLLNFRSILLYKNVRPYIQYNLLHSSVFLNRSHLSYLELYTGIRCIAWRKKLRVRNFFLFVLLKHIMDFKTFFSKITKGSFFVLKIFF